jgi:hypothetical protein
MDAAQADTRAKRIDMQRKYRWLIITAMLLNAAAGQAAFEIDNILKAEMGVPILDVTTKPAGELVFVLTPGAVLIYSVGDQAVLERIAVDKAFDRIAYQDEDRLVLTASQSAEMKIIGYSRIYAIDTTGRAVKGPADAKVTLVVFDDYQ